MQPIKPRDRALAEVLQHAPPTSGGSPQFPGVNAHAPSPGMSEQPTPTPRVQFSRNAMNQQRRRIRSISLILPPSHFILPISHRIQRPTWRRQCYDDDVKLHMCLSVEVALFHFSATNGNYAYSFITGYGGLGWLHYRSAFNNRTETLTPSTQTDESSKSSTRLSHQS